ncbi:hypothetical protein Q7469_08475 [Glaesserella parasuis]|uniref:hypothetical protein n=1 Tax=Glaesserella parasuis TaxID=738 RepID=UPI00271E303D|nr:hypothetical protein [Glaesserella parasuis]MDO9874074.1 hypothetical protein [Glaesserella parasuis]MDO9913765.1 hypothetical protein [Glaesserella parasuis]
MKKIDDLKYIAYSIFIFSLLFFLLLLFWDKKSSLSDITIASCTVGLLMVAVYGIITQLGTFLHQKKDENK